MHGPYTTQIRTTRGSLLAQFTEAELAAEATIVETAHRFYQDATPGLVDGSLRLGAFAAAALLSPGEDAHVVVLGYEGSGSRERQYECRTAAVRRDDAGRFLTTLGSRFNERHFVGV